MPSSLDGLVGPGTAPVCPYTLASSKGRPCLLSGCAAWRERASDDEDDAGCIRLLAEEASCDARGMFMAFIEPLMPFVIPAVVAVAQKLGLPPDEVNDGR